MFRLGGRESGAESSVLFRKLLSPVGPLGILSAALFHGGASTGKNRFVKSCRNRTARWRDRPLSIVEIVFIAPRRRRRRGRALQELRGVMARFARGTRARGSSVPAVSISADLSIQFVKN